MDGGYWAGLLVALPLMANRVLQSLGWSVFYLADPVWQWVLCTAVQGLAGRPYYVGAVRSRGRRGRDLAVILPGLILYLYSGGAAFLLLRGNATWPVLFDVSAAALLVAAAVVAIWNRVCRETGGVSG